MSAFKRIFPKPVPAPVINPPTSGPVLDEGPLPDADSRGFIKAALVVGHTKNAPGARMAKPYSLYEYAYNSKVAEIAEKYAKARYPGIMEIVVCFRDLGGIVGAYGKAMANGCDVAIELHFNAFNGKATGTETLCTPASDDVEFAHHVNKAMVNLFKLPNRGVKPLSVSGRGGASVHSFPQGPNCLVEPFFGDNTEDAAKAMELQEQYAKALVDAIYLWAIKKDMVKSSLK